MSLGFIGTVITGAIISTEHQYLAGVTMAVYSILAFSNGGDECFVVAEVCSGSW
jgi:hypothetical protein